jgi:hypothetical protein
MEPFEKAKNLSPTKKRGRKRLQEELKKSSKTRAKEHRERKKLYIEQLEAENRDLKEKVTVLTMQLQKEQEEVKQSNKEKSLQCT